MEGTLEDIKYHGCCLSLSSSNPSASTTTENPPNATTSDDATMKNPSIATTSAPQAPGTTQISEIMTLPLDMKRAYNVYIDKILARADLDQVTARGIWWVFRREYGWREEIPVPKREYKRQVLELILNRYQYAMAAREN